MDSTNTHYPVPQGPANQSAFYSPDTTVDLPSPNEKQVSGVDHALRRTCGLQRKWLVALIGLAIIIVLGVGLGLGLGLGMKNGSSSENPSTPTPSSSSPTSSARPSADVRPVVVLPNTAMTATLRGDGAGMLLYYQQPDGRVMENFFPNSTLTAAHLNSSSLVPTESNIINTTDIASVSTLTAMSYMKGADVWRTLFYIDTNGTVRVTNSTGLNRLWGTTDTLYSGRFQANSSAMTACYLDPSGPSLFYGEGGRYDWYVNALDKYIGTGQYEYGASIFNVTSSAGFACSAPASKSGLIRQELFMRNDSTSSLEHWWNTADDWESVKEPNALNSAFLEMDADSPIAAATSPDLKSTFVFYHGQTDGGVRQAVLQQNTGSMETPMTFTSWDTDVEPRSRIAAVWLDNGNEGPVVLMEASPGRIGAAVVNARAEVMAMATLSM
ncbi:hypothetical protein C1H76_6818 [Elsinoe australis]|uniref:Fucose-specific lectin n=1 Tax=Elsinoe australis TaxID=40998 RepID=A0A4U7B0W9_9PEZI|nr:hypothetical protein C1H76_6818 [Elsinoe australis]